MRKTLSISTIVSSLMLLIGCAQTETDRAKLKIRSEVWREYSLDGSESSLDTTLVKGLIIKEKKYDEKGRIATVIEFPHKPDIYKRVTTFDSAGNIHAIETFYDESERNGLIEENESDGKGNPVKKVISNLENGERISVASFDIQNEYNDSGLLIKSISTRTDDISETFVTENTYTSNGEIESSILQDHLGNIVSNVTKFIL